MTVNAGGDPGGVTAAAAASAGTGGLREIGRPAERAVLLDGVEVRPRRVAFGSVNAAVLKEAHEGRTEPQEALAHLFLPEGDLHNRPAMLVVHGLGGQKPERELTYGAKLARAGCVALVLDSFDARNMADAHDLKKALSTSTWSILADCFGALRLLAGRPEINPQAIGIMGFSWGGMVSVLSAYEQVRQSYLGTEALRFASHVSYYGCSLPRLEDPAAPGADLLVMVGAADANVSVPRTRRICADLERGGAKVALEVFDTYHQWDGKDAEKRHVFGSLADIGITVTRDNRLIAEGWDAEITGWMTRTLFMVLDLSWAGYDILRDAELHRRTDRLLLDQVGRMAAAAGAHPPEPERVPLGAVGKAPE